MRDIALGSIEAIGGAAKKLGTGIGRLIEKVNPDVWRELGYVTMSSYSLLLPRREQVVDRGADGLVPVVLVHGLGGTRGLWWPLRLFLRMNGHRRIYAFGYEDGRSRHRFSGSLPRALRAIRSATGTPEPDSVTAVDVGVENAVRANG